MVLVQMEINQVKKSIVYFFILLMYLLAFETQCYLNFFLDMGLSKHSSPSPIKNLKMITSVYSVQVLPKVSAVTVLLKQHSIYDWSFFQKPEKTVKILLVSYRANFMSVRRSCKITSKFNPFALMKIRA